jgi:iron complex outermembrane receptor protein
LVNVGVVNGVVGAFYFQEDIVDFLQVPFAAPPPAVAGGAPGSRDYQRAEIDNDNWALFTQWDMQLDSGWGFSAGLRYTEETKGIQIYAFTVTPLTNPNPDPLPTTMPPLNVLPTPFEESFDALTGSASVQYRFTDDVMTYASYSQGFKSGGFNQRFNAPPVDGIPTSFDSEEAETYELGVKTEFGGNFRFNAAIFHTTYTDMQLIYRVGIVPLLFNAGEATIKGAEMEFTYAPGDLIVEGSAGYLDDSFDSITPVPGATATVGPNNTLPFTPDLQANVGIGYTFTFGSGLMLTPRADVSYTDEQYFDAANSVEVAQNEAVTVVGASIALGSDSWRVKGGVNNATDELYPVAGNSSFGTAAGYAEIIYARPRNYYLNVQFDF